MDARWGHAATLALIVGQFAVRVPFARRAERRPVALRRRGPLEVALMALVMLGFLVLPVVAIATPLLDAAAYPLHPAAFSAGLGVAIASLWLCWRSHADLGDQWSATLELKEKHRLVTEGVYARLRHPMYAGLMLAAVAQALLLPNWIAGPAYLVAIMTLYALRVGREERMLAERFGADWDAYAARTGRLIPRPARAASPAGR
jgi:protein-S-isoprenylcysteine O-methyltransferase Ste14